MVHLGALPGAPKARPLSETLDRALADAKVLVAAGFDGVFVENYGDVPFHPGSVPAITVASLTRVAAALRAQLPDSVSLGINVLRNDARSALAIATATEADAIRVNVHTGARVTDQGVIEGRAWETLRLRADYKAAVAIWGDVDVKHSAPLGPPRPIAEEVGDLVHRGLADAVIVTGSGTGRAASTAVLVEVVAAAGEEPVYVGSGVTVETVAALLRCAHGVIVGTALKEGGVTSAPVDLRRCQALVAAAKRM
jgi:membrane complex biogenesis BtpA family protein